MSFKENTYRVYKYTFPNGKIYIGQTKHQLRKRWQLGYQHNNDMVAATKKFGWENTEKEILFDGLTIEEAHKKEIEMIELFESTNPNIGYNISKGGKQTYAGLKHSDEYKKKMSEFMSGRIVSDETRKKLSVANIGKHSGENNYNYRRKKTPQEIEKQYKSHKHQMKSVKQMDLYGNTIAVFNSLHQASKATGVARVSISNSAKGMTKKATKYVWEYVNEVAI